MLVYLVLLEGIALREEQRDYAVRVVVGTKYLWAPSDDMKVI